MQSRAGQLLLVKMRDTMLRSDILLPFGCDFYPTKINQVHHHKIKLNRKSLSANGVSLWPANAADIFLAEPAQFESHHRRLRRPRPLGLSERGVEVNSRKDSNQNEAQTVPQRHVCPEIVQWMALFANVSSSIPGTHFLHNTFSTARVGVINGIFLA